MNMIEKRKAMAGQGGFTLIELLVVVAILAVLGGAVILGVGSLRGSAQEQVCNTNQETVELAITAWETENPGGTADTAAITGAGFIDAADLEGWTVVGGAPVAPAECP